MCSFLFPPSPKIPYMNSHGIYLRFLEGDFQGLLLFYRNVKKNKDFIESTGKYNY